MKTKELASIAMFTAVIAVCAWISIPFPIPLTMQTFGVMLTAGLLGGKNASVAMAVYIALGAVGLPVFAGFSGGIGHLAGASGGFIIGMLFMTLTVWLCQHLSGRKKAVLLLSMIAGLLICYIFGTVWFVLFYIKGTGLKDFLSAALTCVVPYVIPDGIKTALAFYTCLKIQKIKKEKVH